MNEQDEQITTTTYNPHHEENTEQWVFKDSKFMPLAEVQFLGEVSKRTKSGTSVIPCLKFTDGETKYYLSLWSKPFVPLALASGDKCRLYMNKNEKLEVLKLN